MQGWPRNAQRRGYGTGYLFVRKLLRPAEFVMLVQIGVAGHRFQDAGDHIVDEDWLYLGTARTDDRQERRAPDHLGQPDRKLVARAIDERWPENGRGDPAAPHQLLGLPLGPVVSARCPGAGAERALVDKMAYVRFFCGFQKIFRAFNMHALKGRTRRFLNDANEMNHALHALYCLFQGRLVRYVALHNFDAELAEALCLFRISDHCPDRKAVLLHTFDQMTADKTRAAGNEYHDGPPGFVQHMLKTATASRARG